MKRENRAILAALVLLTASGGSAGIDSSGLRIRPPVTSGSATAAWPDRGPAAVRRADGAMRSRLRGLQEAMGARRGPNGVVRTRYFLVGGDLSQEERTRLGTLLDGQVRKLVEHFGGGIEHQPFPSRIGLFILGSRDRFELVEAAHFGCYAEQDLAARLHDEDGAFLLIADASARRGRLDHQTSRAIAAAWLHGLHSPRPVPAWFEQGFMTATGWMQAPVGAGFGRREAIESVRSGRTLEDLLQYQSTWSDDPHNEARAGLLVERLLEQPEALRAWLVSTKQGGDWREEFRECFGSDPEELARHAARWYRVND
ncbi:MAG: hypothetical protein VX727_09770 [Planctomycetota bacterium]|nr:hypothetical protein [Planctomycetota bacterium]